MTRPFKGVINLDVRDSVPDWGPYLPPKAKEGSPNVLYIVLDDTGIAAWDTFGGLIEMPNLTRIAKQGLRYSQFHSTALCSPTRSCLLTGRNCHVNSMACITEAANGFPGASGVIPPECGTLSEILVENGYNTYCVGKWHLTPETEANMSGSKRTWPLGRGFERFYGFLGGETNNWYPDLVYDNHVVDQPYLPEQGYHLSKDLVDRTIQFIQDGQQIAPEKPWFMYLAFGANHAPHHSPREWADKYKGKFDMGYEKYREIVLHNMKRMGLVPRDTQLSPINHWPAPGVILDADRVLPWNWLSSDEKKVFARMAEVYAGFSSYTDYEIGRLLDYLDSTGQTENTIIVVCSDNGASGEGGPSGSVNENKFFNNWRDDIKENIARLDQLGGPNTYNHYPTGWAVAFNTPYKMFKRYSFEGGVCDPLIIAWSREMKNVSGEVREQYHHCIDIVPTILDCAGIEAPTVLKGYTQIPIQGASMRYTFSDPYARSHRRTQYYAMLGARAIYHNGWKAVARHGALSGKGDFQKDHWELYHVEKDRAEVNDLSVTYPEMVHELVGVWFAEAGRNNVLPLDDRPAREQLSLQRPEISRRRSSYTYFPETAEIPEAVSANIRNKSFSVFAEIDVSAADAKGVIFAQGSRFGGHALFIKEHRLYYVYNFLGIEEQSLVSKQPLTTGKVRVGVEFNKTHEDPKFVANGSVKLSINDKIVAEGRMRTQPGKFALAGEGLVVGRDGADAVSCEYKSPFPFTGGKVKQVTFNVNGEHVVDLELEAVGAMERD